MRKILLAIATLFFALAEANAQAPQRINYQAVVRNVSGLALSGTTPVAMRFTIHDGSPTGTSVYTETQYAITNQFGLVNLEIGAMGSLAVVNWANGSKYLQVEVDINNSGTFVDMGSSQLLSVPYALFAANSALGPPGATGAEDAGG